MQQSGKPVFVHAEDRSINLTESFYRTGATTVLCLPLMTSGRVFGAVYLDRLTPGARFTEDDVRVLWPVVGLLSLKVDNLRLFEDHVRLEVGRRELEAARAVQQRFLPRRSVRTSGYGFHAVSQPCQHVGGDCVDFVLGAGNKLVFALGDVAGKGLPAALYMVGVLSTLRAHLEDGFEIQDVMAKLEQYVRSTFKPEHFLTMFLGQVDQTAGLLKYCNAGHLPPLVFSEDGLVTELEGGDPALNITPWSRFTVYQRVLNRGDLLVAYTDGLTERENPQGEAFSMDRLVDCTRKNRGNDLQTIANCILEMQRRFAGGEGDGDDTTLVLLRRDHECS
jgi:sigma-B regulation protein RsbU (phosphoserine phosphatase)